MLFGEDTYELTAAVITKPMHFIGVTKLQGKFFNMDNLDQATGKQGFSCFKAAVMNKELKHKEELVLDKRSRDSRRAGAVQYAIYVSKKGFPGNLFKMYHDVSVDVNRLLENVPDKKLLDARVENSPAEKFTRDGNCQDHAAEDNKEEHQAIKDKDIVVDQLAEMEGQLTPLTNVGVGDMVVARFTEDWQLYRVKVIFITNVLATILHSLETWSLWLRG